MGIAVGLPVAPTAFARWLQLELAPVTYGRAGLFGDQLVYNDTAPQQVQDYQIARAASAFALGWMGLIRLASPHDLAVELCGVSSSDPRGRERIASVTYLHHAQAARGRRRTGMLLG